MISDREDLMDSANLIVLGLAILIKKGEGSYMDKDYIEQRDLFEKLFTKYKSQYISK